MAVRQGKGERKNQKSPEGIQIGQIPVIFLPMKGRLRPMRLRQIAADSGLFLFGDKFQWEASRVFELGLDTI